MTAEGTFPKISGDILYASEVNKFKNDTTSVKAKDLAGGSTTSTSYVQIGTCSVAAGAITSYIIGHVNLKSSLPNSANGNVGTHYDILIGTTSLQSDEHFYGAWNSNPLYTIAGAVTNTITFYYEPTTGEKSAGFNVVVKGKCDATALTIACKQIIVTGG